MQADSRAKEIETIVNNKVTAKAELENIESELQSLKEGTDVNENKAASEKIEGSWLVFITQTKNVISNLIDSIEAIKVKLTKQES